MRTLALLGVLLATAPVLAANPADERAIAAPAPTTDIKTRAEAVVSIERNVRGREASTAAIAEAFRRIQNSEFEPSALATYDTRTLEVLFEALRIASDNLRQPGLVRPLEDIFAESLRRGFVGHMDEDLYVKFVQQRRWQKARELNERFPSKDRELPTIVEPDSPGEDVPAVYLVSEDGRTLRYSPVNLDGPIIVSVVSPGCPASNKIVRTIEADPKLAALFRDHAVNVDPAPFRLKSEELARINREGAFRYVVLSRASGWRDFDFSSTPQFYFVKGGAILHKFGGVRPDEFPSKLAEGLAAIGL